MWVRVMATIRIRSMVISVTMDKDKGVGVV